MAEIDKGAVCVAYVHSNDVCYSWHHSMIELIGWDMAHEGRVIRGGWIAMRCGADGLPKARNDAARIFLEERDAEWLFWIDTDMGFEPDIIERLWQAADAEKRPVVGALAFSYQEKASDGLGGWITRPAPTIFDWVKLDNDQMGFAIRWGYPRNTLVRCAGTGSAAILIHRSALAAVAKEYGNAWYDRIPNTTTGQLVGEDLSLCLRLGALNIPVFVHTGVPTNHQKTIWVDEVDYAGSLDPSPAEEATAVLVPAIRSTNAHTFMTSLRASTGVARAYAVANEGEDAQAEIWAAEGATVLRASGARTFAQRMNAGYRMTDEPWLFITGDDVRFKPGWLDHAQTIARDVYDVIGTNDLGNPRVMDGQHATHMLIRRAYVDKHGASWDGAGVLAHEGYRHWFVDDEIVNVAKSRGTFISATDSIVEHMHPGWLKGPDDELYELGQSFADVDRALWLRRSDSHAS